MNIFNKKNYIFISIITLNILFLMFLGYYPGIVSYDGNYQWQQVKSGIITNSHPFFSTYFMFLLSKIWNNISVVVIFQMILVSISWAYLCKCIKIKTKWQLVFIYIYTIILFLIPLISIYSITVLKDIIYTCYLFLVAIMLYEWSNNDYKFCNTKYCLLGLLLSMVFSYRHNGIIVAIMLFTVYYIICIKKYRNKLIEKKELKKTFLTFLSFVVVIICIFIPKHIILKQSQEKLVKQTKNEISISTIDSYMLWMMGSHINDNNIKDMSDRKFLNNVIPLKEWKKVYNPYLINSTTLAPNLDKKYLVKNSSKFERIFIKYSLNNPMAIIKHYFRSDALLINPVSSLDGYVYVYCFPEMLSLPKYTTIKSRISIINELYNKLMEYSFKKTFIIFYEPAFILYLSLILTIILSKRVYGKKIWLFMLPMILNTVSLLPINLAQDLRYVYINYWTFFGLLLMFCLNIGIVFKKENLLIKSYSKAICLL